MDYIIKDREIENGIIIPITLQHNDKGDPIRVTDEYIDISYQSQDTPARVLSNLNPYEFYYFGHIANSIEAVLQSLKYSDRRDKIKCYKYRGLDAYHLRGMEPYAWEKDGILYTPYGKIDRFSEDYQKFIDKLYFSVFRNSLYRNNLFLSGDKKLDHTHGENKKEQTILTRTEYISRLYALRYCISKGYRKKKDIIGVLEEVRKELNLKRVL